jgi:Calx-beta domain/FG-GAP-like repeat/FG-GAP repeat
MSLHSWLQNLRSALAPRRGQRHHGRQSSLRAARYRPGVECLEDRLTPSFSPAASYPVAASPQAIVTGDFNCDGRLDLATASPGSHSVSVLPGDGVGGFGAAIVSAGTPTGYPAGSLTVADFNNDGHLDLATAMYGFYEGATYGSLEAWLGNGDGTFQSPASVPSGAPTEVVAGDFNNDGNSDLVVIAEYGWDPYIEVWLGNGQGGFGPAQRELSGWVGLAVGDLNRDGNLDAVSLGSDSVDTFLGNGAGGFFSSGFAGYSTSGTQAVAVGDFTGDGIPDLSVAGAYGVDIFVGLGDGAFADPVFNSANGYWHPDVAVADFNGDGKLDAVKSDADTGTVSELLGNGNGALTYAGAYAVGLSPSAIAVGDFNGDGRPDVATANAGSNTVSVLLNNGTWTPPPPPPPAVRIRDVTVIEGNTGAVSAEFTVTLSAASTQPVTVAYATGNDTATAGSDYQTVSGTLTFAPGETSQTFTVPVIGDRLPESTETFLVNLSSPTNAIIADGRGLGTIVDDEPRIRISDVTRAEGKKGQTTLFTFTVTLSVAYDQAMTVSYRTVDGTATSGTGGNADYIARTGTLTFAPGETTKSITIEVKGDNKWEADETFYLDLFGLSSNALLIDGRGVGTIVNDD